MTREEAFDIGNECLDLVQDLGGHVVLRDPKNLKKNLSKKDLRDEITVSHEAMAKAAEMAYALFTKITRWADEYPILGEK
jgi:hypothetical protein